MASFSDTLELIISANAQGAVSELNSFAGAVDSKMGQAESRLKSFSATALKLGGSGLAIGGVLTALGSKEEEAGNQLQQAISNVGQSYEDFSGKIDQTIAHQENYGHTASDTETALTSLTTAFGDTGQALDHMQLVADLAARKHESLAEAATQVAKAHGGAARIFKEFGVQVQTNADGTKNYDGALDVLAGKLNGSAAASVDSFMGHLRVLGAHVEDIAASFGEHWGPTILGVSAGLTALGPIVGAFGTGIGKLTGLFKSTADGAEAVNAANEAVAPSATGAAVAIDAEAVAAEGATTQLDLFGASAEGTATQLALFDTAVEESAGTSIFATTGIAGLAVGLGTLAVGFAAVAGVAYVIQGPMEKLSSAFLGTNDAAFDAAKSFTGFDQQADALRTNLENLGPDTKNAAEFMHDFASKATEAGDGGQEFARALVAAHVNTGDFVAEVEKGPAAFNEWINSQLKSGAITADQGIALAKTAGQMQQTAENALELAHAQGKLSDDQYNSAIAAGKAADGSVDYAKALDSVKESLGNAGDGGEKILDMFGRIVPKEKDATDVQDSYNKAVGDFPGFVSKFASAMGTAYDATIAGQRASIGYHDAIDKLTGAFAHASAPDLSQNLRDISKAQLNAKESTRSLADEQKKLNDMRAGGKASAEDIAAQEIRVQQAQLATQDATASVADAQSKLNDARAQGKFTIDDNTEAGRKNLGLVLDAGEAISKEIQQRFEETHSVKAATDAGAVYVENLKNQLKAAGLTDDQVSHLIDTMHLTPKDINTTFATNGASEQLVVGEYLKEMDKIPPDKQTVIAALINQGDFAGAQAALDGLAAPRFADIFPVVHPPPDVGGNRLHVNRWGGIESYAAGGLAPGVYQGTMIRAFEPETGGEAYVPRLGDPSRSVGVLQQAAGWYGMEVVPRGATTGRSARGAAGGGTYAPTYQVSVNGSNLSADEIVTAIKKWEQRNGSAWRAN